MAGLTSSTLNEVSPATTGPGACGLRGRANGQEALAFLTRTTENPDRAVTLRLLPESLPA
jgi:hypothetical protein